jgi:Ca2+-binding RTX toxin-like protein
VQQMLKAGFNYTGSNANPDMLTVTANDGTTSEITNFVFANATGATLTGTSNKDVVIGSHGNDTMTGAAGADTFVFAPNHGHDAIADFMPDVDLIQFSSSMFANQQAILNATQDNLSGFAVITTSAGHDVTLNVAKAQLDAADFRLV